MDGRASIHEDFGRAEKVEGSSDRGFGFTFAAVFIVLAAWNWWGGHSLWLWALPVAAVFAALALVAPSLLSPLNRAWTRLGLILFKVVSPLVMGLLFISTIVPIGVLRRALRKDALHLAFDRAASSYWIKREPPGPPPGDMKNQF